MNEKQSRFSRPTIALFWLSLIAIVIGVIIYYEQIALLYVLATVGLVVLLLVVGFSDLENVGRERAERVSTKENIL
jgi:membrane protein YdbS with pleckstrin-like domain